MEGLESAHDAPPGTSGAETLPVRGGLVEEPEPAHDELMTGITTDEAAQQPVSHERDPPHTPEVATRCSSTSSFGYAPQFSATQSLILSRIRQNALLQSNAPTPSLLAPTTQGDTKEHPPQQAVHSKDPAPSPARLGETLAMPGPSPREHAPPSAAARIVDAADPLHRLGLKRKRDQADVDAAARRTMFLPVLSAAPARREEELVHRNHDGKRDKAISHRVVNEEELEKLRSRNLAALPEGVFPAKAELVGFPAGQASDLALTEYFYGKKRTDLLNILSFADQLHPQLLVDVLVSVSKRHPDLPIFSSPRWNAEPPSSRNGAPLHLKLARKDHHHPHRRHPLPHAKPRHGHVILVPADAKSRAAKHAAKSGTTPRKSIKLTAPFPASADETSSALPPPLDAVEDEEPDEDDDDDDDDDYDEEENRDSLPPTWPKAGEGLYAKLTAEDEDRALLVDENDEEAFSHFAVDRYGKQMALLLPACG